MLFQLGDSAFGGEKQDRGTEDIRDGLVSGGNAIGDEVMHESNIAQHLVGLSEAVACCVEPHTLPVTLLPFHSHNSTLMLPRLPTIILSVLKQTCICNYTSKLKLLQFHKSNFITTEVQVP